MNSASAHVQESNLQVEVRDQKTQQPIPARIYLLPPGRYHLLVERGPEYRSRSASIEIRAGEDRKETLLLDRWIDMNDLGWYSGDLHNHRAIQEMPALLLAEDLNLAPTLTDWIWEDRPRSSPPQTSEAVRQVDSTHAYADRR